MQLVGAKLKTVAIRILEITENTAIQLVVTGSDLDSVLKFAQGAEKVLDNILGATETKRSVKKRHSRNHVQVNREKISAIGLLLQTIEGTMHFTNREDTFIARI